MKIELPDRELIPIGDLPIGDLPIGDLPIGDLPIGDLPIGDLPIGEEFSLRHDCDRLFIRIRTLTDRDKGTINCVNLADGEPHCVVNNGMVVRRKAVIRVER